MIEEDLYETPQILFVGFCDLQLNIVGLGDCSCFIRRTTKLSMDKDTFCARLKSNKWGLINLTKSGRLAGLYRQPYFHNTMLENPRTFAQLLGYVQLCLDTKCDKYTRNHRMRLSEVLELCDYDHPCRREYYDVYDGPLSWTEYALDRIYTEAYAQIFQTPLEQLCNFELTISDGNEEIMYFEDAEYRYGISVFK